MNASGFLSRNFFVQVALVPLAPTNLIGMAGSRGVRQSVGVEAELAGDRLQPFAPFPDAEDVMHVLQAAHVDKHPRLLKSSREPQTGDFADAQARYAAIGLAPALETP